MIQDYISKVIKHELISPKIYLTTLELIEPEEIEFLAGQYISLDVGRGQRRSYSIASVPAIKNEIDLLVDVSPQGPGSEFFKNLKIGDRVEFKAPLGKFVLETGDGDYLFLATGTGLAPFMAMIPVLLEKISTQVNFLLGFRFLEDIFYEKELSSLKEKYPNFDYKICLSKPSESWSELKGHLTEYLEDFTPNHETNVYLCGNKAMVDEARIKLRGLGVPEENVHFEQYY